MMNVLRITFSILCLVFCFKSARTSFEKSALHDFLSKEANNLELKPMFSKDYDAQVNGEVPELKEFFDKYNSVCSGALQKYENLVKTVNNYVQRYVSLFLIISGIFDQEGKGSNEMITVDLEITMSPEEFAYLQDIPRRSEGSFLRDLSKLEVILSKIAKKKERGYLEWTFRAFVSILSFLWQILYYLLFKSNLYYFAPLLTILLVTCIIYCFSPQRSFYVYLSIIINSMIFWDALNLYRRKIKDVEAELETLKLQVMPEECDPQNAKWYHLLTSLFSGNKCLEYYKNLNRNPSDEVSLFRCLVDTYSFHTVQAVSRILGASIRDFTGEIAALWPKPMQWLVCLPFLPFVIILVTFSILILFGKRLRLSFFGASVEIGDAPEEKKNRKGSKLIASYRPLRIMARSRFFRRSELNLAKEKKCILRDSKSESAVDYKNVDDAEPIEGSSSEIAVNKTDDVVLS